MVVTAEKGRNISDNNKKKRKIKKKIKNQELKN